MPFKVICIDGPSASGKGTLAKKLAKHLGFEYLDSGLLYRAFAYILSLSTNTSTQQYNNDDLDLNLNLETLNKFIAIFKENIEFKNNTIFYQNQEIPNIQTCLRTEEIGLKASYFAKIPEVRLGLLDAQRSIAQKSNIIADGRDMGSFIFPNADVKIFLTANLETRALRRYLEMPQLNIDSNLDLNNNIKYQKTLASIKTRDEQDQNRASSPLIMASDAVLLDSENLTSDEVFTTALGIILEKIKI